MGRKGLEINKKYFSEHEKRMNQFVCKFLLGIFFIIPIMAIVHFSGVTLYSDGALAGLVVIGSICTLTPSLLEKYLGNQMAVKYYTFLCGLLFVSYLVIAYRIGISIAFFLPTFASCLYFNPTFTVTMTTLSYIAYFLSSYLRMNILRSGEMESTWRVSNLWASGIGFTIEFVISALLFYALTMLSRELFVKQKLLVAELEKNNEKMRMAMGAATDILFEYDIANDRYTSNRTIRGWKEKEIEISDFKSYISQIQWETDDFLELFQRIIYLPVDRGDHFQEEICINFEENGIKYPAWANFEINILRNKTGKPITVLGKLRDITEYKLEERKRKEEKRVDTLTGMYTYDSFKRLIEEMNAKKSGLTHQIMVIHVKNYQEIAECYGEVYRDYVILNLSDYIRKKIEHLDVLACRLASDVFLLYVNDGETLNGRALRQELNHGMRELYIGEKEIQALEFDFGYYSGKETIDELLQVAFEYLDEETEFTADKGLQSLDDEILTSVHEERLFDIPQYQRPEAVEKFSHGISSLILGAKDQQSTIQMILDRLGKFFGLDAIRVYELPDQRHSVLPAFLWTEDEEFERKCSIFPLSELEQRAFSENFGKSRIIDNTVKAFREFFSEDRENPLVLEDYSSLLCPLSVHDRCQGVLIFDRKGQNYQWSDEQKEYLSEVNKVIGNYILVAVNSDLIRQQRVFLTTMSRMLRMPMNSIFELTDIARQSLDNPSELVQYMDMIDVSSESMLHVVNSIIDLSKLNLDSLVLSEGIFSLEDLLSRVEEKLLPSAKEKNISLLIERRFGDNLLRGDSRRLEQILLTLVKNAIYYAANRGIIHLIVKEQSKENNVVELCFIVKDNNAGIPKHIMSHLFDVFADKKVERTERELGTEMDLGVCYQLVHVMGSELEVESGEGKGTTFEFVLKLGQASGEHLLQFFSQKKREEQGRIELSGRKILVAEDDRINGEILKRLFEKNGAIVDVAENGKRCLELFENSEDGEYFFILMDISMPVLNGHETTRQIRKLQRQDAKKIPILALSANAFQEDIHVSMEAGMNAHLAKPVHMEQILEELSKAKEYEE